MVQWSTLSLMAKPVDALDYLAKPAKFPPAAVMVLFGDESYLKRQVLAAVKEQVLAGEDAEFSVTEFRGPRYGAA